MRTWLDGPRTRHHGGAAVAHLTPQVRALPAAHTHSEQFRKALNYAVRAHQPGASTCAQARPAQPCVKTPPLAARRPHRCT